MPGRRQPRLSAPERKGCWTGLRKCLRAGWLHVGFVLYPGSSSPDAYFGGPGELIVPVGLFLGHFRE